MSAATSGAAALPVRHGVTARCVVRRPGPSRLAQPAAMRRSALGSTEP
jgi:hypothetical protein